MPSELHAKVTELLDSTHCAKHGMEWEKCCLMEVSLELHCKIMQLIEDPPNATTVAPQTCAECGHSNVSEDGTCAELLLGPVPLAGMVYCGCACDFPARAEQVDAVAAERERCAQIAANWWTTKSTVGSPEAEAFQVASFEIANTIRRKLTK